MENKKKIKVALIRGNSLNEWEGKAWNKLRTNFEVTAFCSKKNLYTVKNLDVDVGRLLTTTDNFFANQYSKFLKAQFQKMYGLEKALKNFSIAHTAELYHYYTYQAVRAKDRNPKLRVVSTVWDNSFGRFEYNYWPGFFKFPPRFWRQKIKKQITDTIAGVDMFLPVSKASEELLLDYGVSPSKIQRITPAIGEFSREKGLLENEWKGKEMYLMVNRLVKEKGVYDILYAWKIFLRETNSANKILLIIGQGKEKENLERLIKEWKIEAETRIIGVMENAQVRSLYSHARALLLCSLPTSTWQEQFGYVLGEAITAGCPVIATSTGSIQEVVADAGILVPPGNPIAIKDALLSLEQPQKHAILVSRAHKLAQKFDEQKFVDSLRQVYTGLIG